MTPSRDNAPLLLVNESNLIPGKKKQKDETYIFTAKKQDRMRRANGSQRKHEAISQPPSIVKGQMGYKRNQILASTTSKLAVN